MRLVARMSSWTAVRRSRKHPVDFRRSRCPRMAECAESCFVRQRDRVAASAVKDQGDRDITCAQACYLRPTMQSVRGDEPRNGGRCRIPGLTLSKWIPVAVLWELTRANEPWIVVKMESSGAQRSALTTAGSSRWGRQTVPARRLDYAHVSKIALWLTCAA